MKSVLCFLTAVLPTAVHADPTLADLIGGWSGSGLYQENDNQGQLRCRMQVDGDAAAITMHTRCAFAAGSGTSIMQISQRPDGTLTANISGNGPGGESPITMVVGQIGADRVILTGSAEGAEAVVLFRFDPEGRLHVATQHDHGGTRRLSGVDFTRN